MNLIWKFLDLFYFFFYKIALFLSNFFMLCSYFSLWFFSAPPHFSEKSVRLSVRKGERASLICEASGDQPMDISWKRNGIPISQDEDAR